MKKLHSERSGQAFLMLFFHGITSSPVTLASDRGRWAPRKPSGACSQGAGTQRPLVVLVGTTVPSLAATGLGGIHAVLELTFYRTVSFLEILTQLLVYEFSRTGLLPRQHLRPALA